MDSTTIVMAKQTKDVGARMIKSAPKVCASTPSVWMEIVEHLRIVETAESVKATPAQPAKRTQSAPENTSA